MSNKKRIMKILEYLRENTNEDHKVNSENIISYLHSQSIEVERKTVYNDIATLTDMDYDIEKDYDGYYYDNELFDLAELRVLVDEVRASNFLSNKKTDEVVNKLLSLTNKYDRSLVTQDSYENNKTDNEHILYNIDAIIKAIDKHQAITFKYYDITSGKTKTYRKHNYEVYPYSLIINNNRYYLICQSTRHDSLSNYRLDKMESVVANPQKTYEKMPVDINEYMKKTFSMFGGEARNITLRCKERFYDEIEKQFGDTAIFKGSQDGYVVCNANAFISPTFFSWLFSFGGEIQIVQPEDVKNQFIQMCQSLIKAHQ